MKGSEPYSSDFQLLPYLSMAVTVRACEGIIGEGGKLHTACIYFFFFSLMSAYMYFEPVLFACKCFFFTVYFWLYMFVDKHMNIFFCKEDVAPVDLLSSQTPQVNI